MSRKKISEMSTQELADLYLKKVSWEQAEEVGIEILARCLARHNHVIKDYSIRLVTSMLSKMTKRSIEWAKENSFALAGASVIYDHFKEDKGTDDKCCGSCKHFYYEDTDGYGFCRVGKHEVETRCSDVCNKFEHD